MVDDFTPQRANDSWKIRRKIIFSSLIFCAAVIIYILAKGEDARIYETALIGAYGLAMAVIGSYVFGAVWDDNNVRLTSAATSRSLPSTSNNNVRTRSTRTEVDNPDA